MLKKLLSVLLILLIGSFFTTQSRADTTTRVSVAWDGTQGNGNSGYPSISADGRYVAFLSNASNLVPGDTNGFSDVFVHDRQTGQTMRVSVASDGTQGNGDSDNPSISADGRYVAFLSNASNLVPGDTNGFSDVFVHDRQTGQTMRVSVASDGTQGNSASLMGSISSISADGRYIAFYSYASNLVPGDANGFSDVFVHDRQTGQTTRVSEASDGTQGNNQSFGGSISADGRYLVFDSVSSNLVAGGTNGLWDVFVRDLQTGQTTLVSVASDGTQENNHSNGGLISADGRYVVFYSSASNLVPGDTNGNMDVFVRDLQTGQTTLVSVASDGTQGNSISYPDSISADGRYVAFQSNASNLVPGDTNGFLDVFVHDRQTGQTTRASVASDGTQGYSYSYNGSISADGRYVAFTSYASNLVAEDTNGVYDVFVHEIGSSSISGPLDHFEFSNISSPQSINAPFSVTITAKDENGNIITNLNGWVRLSVSIGNIIPTTTYLTNGVASSVQVVLDSGGNNIRLFVNYQGVQGESNTFNVTGESNKAAVGGTVKTLSGTVLVGATVYLDNGGTPLTKTTDQNGVYQFHNLSPGRYSIWAESAIGVKSKIYSIDLADNQSLTRHLRIGNACNPNGRIPILLVPGMMGSSTSIGIPFLPKKSPEWNDAEWDLIHFTNFWGLYEGAGQVGWKNLFDSFKSVDNSYEIGCTIFPVPYDWRMYISGASKKYLVNKINEAKQKAGTDKVHIIAHSMGGLLTRSYIQSNSYQNDIDKFAMVGTPNHGAVAPYFLWEGGNPILADIANKNIIPLYSIASLIMYKTMYDSSIYDEMFNVLNRLFPEMNYYILAAKLLKKFLTFKYDMYTLYREHIPSINQLLPVGSDIGNFLVPNGALTCESNFWLNFLNNSATIERMGKSSEIGKVKTKIFRGNFNSTLNRIRVGKRDCGRELFYRDGGPILLNENPSFSYLNTGDGTALMESAYLGDFVDYQSPEINESHLYLIDKYKNDLVFYITGNWPMISFEKGKIGLGQNNNVVNTIVVNLQGRTQPYLIDPLGGKNGINPDTGLFEKGVSGGETYLNLYGGSITIENVPNGSYTLYLKNARNEDFGLSFSFIENGTTSHQMYHLFNHANSTSLNFTVNSTSSEKITVIHTPTIPTGLLAQAEESGGLKTRLSWNANADTGIVGYNIYSKYEDEPYFAQIGTSTNIIYDTGDPWAADTSTKTRLYAISAVNFDGSESFLSVTVKNNDRDHDALTDQMEADLGTNLNNPDTDGDGLLDGEEYYLGTNPKLADTDGDGYSDYQEYVAGSDPLDPNSTPKYFLYLPLILR